MASWRNWIAHLITNQKVECSNHSEVTKEIVMNDLIIVYLKETDGEIVIEKIDDEKHLDELTADMHPEDYALIGGVVYKDFEQKVNKEEFKKALNIMSKNKKYKR